ncbi:MULTISPECIES: cobalt-precorrin-6A reductase [Pseudonocardia]|uniref:Precorrin-6A reductase n=2 Tax=Pseudonocardia TaxID=1847 RepID=A0A1Y2N602_PSEAH|nr:MULTISPECIES: cobalt-precorrin-6A reductase [Pseudonocardia]OSY42895.1 Precorrin-6A reductase [Pseudonocardia autotrophica]TDN77473.1 precorrin-6A/cobalt-precorrin-6A reductase [Pseudonocardia autotrophica]BBG01495.1 precorrin-6A reductase [Pseudonocardia autotrophica]GEC25279.1 precorrin-6A reductase [Pseudonocardia saturnea]
MTGPHTVLVLGGTTEGRAAAAELAARDGVRVISSLAGAVRSPRLPDGEVRIGGFGGADGLARYLRAERVSAVLDATHPFAATMTANAAAACATTGTPLVVLRRPGWTAGPGDRWHRVGSVAAAAAALPALLPGPSGRVLLTTGRGGLAEFAALDAAFWIRSVDPPGPPLPRRHTLLLDRGPFTLDSERELLAGVRPDVLVTKDSGGDATAAKLVAARERGITVVVVDRPGLPPGVRGTDTVGRAIALLL